MIDYIGKSNQFKGMVFCFTGKAPKPRTEMTAMAIAAGASVTKSITRLTNTLVIADPNSMSKKAIKARLMGISLITPEEFFDLCDNPVPVDNEETYLKPLPKTKNKATPKSPDKKSRYSDKRRIQL